MVFLGTPEPAAMVLRRLVEESKACGAGGFDVAAVVTRPSRRLRRGKRLEGSPVASTALDLGIAEDCIVAPDSARDEAFLEWMHALRPSLCVTAAYGAVLPQRFLDIPTRGTVNIHPSALPEFRGPAPVQRAMLRGDRRLAVSLAFTVLRMDAGPVVRQTWHPVPEDATATWALETLFERGADLLVEEMPGLLSGAAAADATPQRDDDATEAPKLAKADGDLDVRGCTAREIHDRVCALAMWPGTRARFAIRAAPAPALSTSTASTSTSASGGEKKAGKEGKGGKEGMGKGEGTGGGMEEVVWIKLAKTSVVSDAEREAHLAWFDAAGVGGNGVGVNGAGGGVEVGMVAAPRGKGNDHMVVACKGGSLLMVGEMQLPGKKAMTPKAFFNGRKGAKLVAV